jgi:hypothetical protein
VVPTICRCFGKMGKLVDYAQHGKPTPQSTYRALSPMPPPATSTLRRGKH